MIAIRKVSVTKNNKDYFIVKHMECPICYTQTPECTLDCDHSFCYHCISQWYQKYKNSRCPMCRKMSRIPHCHYEVVTTCNMDKIPYNSIENIKRLRNKYVNFEFIPKLDNLRRVRSSEKGTTVKYTFKGDNSRVIIYDGV